MANNKVEQVFVCDYWGARGQVVTPGIATGIPAAAFPGGRINVRRGPIGDLSAGDFVALVPDTQSAYNLPTLVPILAAPGNQAVFNPASSRLQFGSADAAVGVRLSEVIEFSRIYNMTMTPFQTQTPNIKVFHACYNPNANTINTARGSTISISISVHKTWSSERVQDLFFSAQVGPPTPPSNFWNNVPPVAATDAEIQRAHFDLLNNILNADPDGLLFDRNASLALTGSALNNYRAIFLVSAFKRVLEPGHYATFRENIMDVSLIEGFNNRVVEEPLTVAGFNASLTAATYSSYLGTYLQPDPGSGNYAQVSWHEKEQIGQRGHRNSIEWATPVPYKSQPGSIYDTLNIEFFNNLVLSGENHDKNLHKRITVYVRRNDVANNPINAAVGNWQNGTFAGVPPNFANPANIVYTPIGAGPGAVVPIAGFALYVPPVVPAQLGVNLAFMNTLDTDLNNAPPHFVGAINQYLRS